MSRQTEDLAAESGRAVIDYEHRSLATFPTTAYLRRVVADVKIFECESATLDVDIVID